jgi:hypothetical protein
MGNFKISDYLEGFCKDSQREKCKSCSKLVSWIRERVASHKRSNCSNVSAEDLASTQQVIVESSKETIDAAIGNLFYRSGISSRIVDSPAWNQMMTLFNPTYASNMPSSKALSGRLLDQQYVSELRKCTTKFI